MRYQIHNIAVFPAALLVVYRVGITGGNSAADKYEVYRQSIGSARFLVSVRGWRLSRPVGELLGEFDSEAAAGRYCHEQRLETSAPVAKLAAAFTAAGWGPAHCKRGES
jgi:hypothetical protein